MSDDNTPNTPDNRPAVGGPMHRTVRPSAEENRLQRHAALAGACALLPEGSAWGDTLTPEIAMAIADAATEHANAKQNAAWRLMSEKMVAAERERIAEWLEAQRNDTPAQGIEFAAALRALGPNV